MVFAIPVSWLSRAFVKTFRKRRNKLPDCVREWIPECETYYFSFQKIPFDKQDIQNFFGGFDWLEPRQRALPDDRAVAAILAVKSKCRSVQQFDWYRDHVCGVALAGAVQIIPIAYTGTGGLYVADLAKDGLQCPRPVRTLRKAYIKIELLGGPFKSKLWPKSLLA